MPLLDLGAKQLETDETVKFGSVLMMLSLNSLSQMDPFQSWIQEQTNFPLFSLQVPP